jgi:phosphatidate cytidylyltransferase
MQSLVQRVLFGLLAILAIVSIVLVDITVSRTLLQPESINTATLLGRWIDSAATAIADTSVGDLLKRGSTIPLVFQAMLLIGGFEMKRLLAGRGFRPHARFAMFMAAVMFLSPWFAAAGWLGTKPHHLEGHFWYVVWFALTLVGAGVLCIWRRQPAGMLGDYGSTLLMVVYLGFLPSFATQLRCNVDLPLWDGAWLLVVMLLVIKASDIGAYLVGTAIGRHKLIPSISPAKSVEGMLGGLAFSMLAAILLAWSGRAAGALDGAHGGAVWQEIGLVFGREVTGSWLDPISRAAIFGFCMSAMGQFGDLLESGFKRDGGIKDSGHIIPRFGGILDLIDSPVLAMPVGWFLLTEWWGVA